MPLNVLIRQDEETFAQIATNITEANVPLQVIVQVTNVLVCLFV